MRWEVERERKGKGSRVGCRVKGRYGNRKKGGRYRKQ